MNIYIEPRFRGEDKGDGGIRRVVEAQHKHLPSFGHTIVDNVDQADIIHTHAGITVDVPPQYPPRD